MPVTPVKFAVLGYGHIGKRHADMINANEHCELAAIIDIDENALHQAEQQYKTHTYNSLDAFLSSDIDCDVINIATPNGLHAKQACMSLQKGKDVVVEKPMALTVHDCRRVLDVAEQNKRQVFCVMQNRYSAPMQWLKSLLKNDILGKIYLVDIHAYWNRGEQYYKGGTWHGKSNMDGGTLFTQFSHYVDILAWLFGDIDNIIARFANNNHEGLIDFEDSGIVQFDFKKEGSGSLIYSTSAYEKNMESSMVVLAENGTLKIGGQYMDKIEYCHIKDYQLPDDINTNNKYTHALKGNVPNHYFVMQNVADVLRNGSDITTNATEGMQVVDMIERIYALKK